jgi:uncharacterized protein (DUF58 family)
VTDTDVFPLVPRHRLIGLAFGAVESLRRGKGFDLVGSRPYAPGDPVQAIDWKLSARLATARDADEFVVLERSAEEAPRVVVVVDRRPEMALYESDAPWLCKPAAVEAIVQLVDASTRAAHGLLGYIDLASSDDGRGFWRPPSGRAHADELLDRVRRAPFDAQEGSLTDALTRLGELRRDLPAGSFVFLVSDFLSPPAPEAWSRAQSRRWELVPVIVQDPTWEQDFPAIASVVTPFANAANGRVEYVRLSRKEVEARRDANRLRLARLLEDFEARDLDPVLISSAEREEILRAFLDWHERRGLGRRRLW